jgi:hypothetical protein
VAPAYANTVTFRYPSKLFCNGAGHQNNVCVYSVDVYDWNANEVAYATVEGTTTANQFIVTVIDLYCDGFGPAWHAAKPGGGYYNYTTGGCGGHSGNWNAKTSYTFTKTSASPNW